MKKIFYSSMCCLILAAGCAKEEETGPDTGLAADDHFYVVVDLPQPQTRASMGAANDEEYEFAWDDADEFGAVVYDGSEYTLHKFTQKSGKDNIFGTDTFVPEKDASYTWYLLYPYDESFMVNGDLSSSPVVNVPAQIAGCEPDALTHLAVPFYSKVETEGFDSFYAVVQNPLAVLNISISNMTGEELLLSEIQVSGGLSGDFVLDFSTGALTSQAQAASGFTISLEDEDISDDETQSYYLTCAPVAVTSPIEVKVLTDKGEFSSIAEYEEGFAFQAGGVYTIDVECNPMAIKGTAVPDGLAELTATVENPAVYAWAGELSAGKMSIVLPQGEVKPADGTFGAKSDYTVASEYVYDIPDMGDYRVVLDTENGTVVVYNPETDLKPFEVTWYEGGNPENEAHTAVVVDKLWIIGAGSGNWDDGAEQQFTPSQADPQVLVYKGGKLGKVGGQTKFSVAAGADWYLGSYFNDTDGDGVHDTGDGSDSGNKIKAKVDVPNNAGWIPMYGGYDMRECWWIFKIWPTTLIIDLRNMQLYAVEE